MESAHDHARVIDELGGPTRVAELLGIISVPGAVQRVSNWKRRGIPPAILLHHPDVFRKLVSDGEPMTAPQI